MLDEPTSGLEPLMEAVFTECVDELKNAGGTVLLSSHILAELRRLTTSVRAELASTASGLDALHGVHDLVVEDDRVSF